MNSAERNLRMDESPSTIARASDGKAIHGVRPVLGLALLLTLSCGPSLAQSSSEDTGTWKLSNNPLRLERRDVQPTPNTPESDPVDEQKQVRELAAKVHKSIVSDTDKLKKLVTELNAEVDRKNPASLTPEQLQKVAAIEKLAHSLREEMKSTAKEPPSFIDSAQPLPNYRDRR